MGTAEAVTQVRRLHEVPPLYKAPSQFPFVDGLAEALRITGEMTTGEHPYFRIPAQGDRGVRSGSVERVAANFGTPAERGFDRMSLAGARVLLAAGEFPPGSMAPKAEAGVRFVEVGGREAIITLDRVRQALAAEEAGTHIVPLERSLCCLRFRHGRNKCGRLRHQLQGSYRESLPNKRLGHRGATGTCLALML